MQNLCRSLPAWVDAHAAAGAAYAQALAGTLTGNDVSDKSQNTAAVTGGARWAAFREPWFWQHCRPLRCVRRNYNWREQQGPPLIARNAGASLAQYWR
jgi:hypothetical protein